jgi:hypothetical protein
MASGFTSPATFAAMLVILCVCITSFILFVIYLLNVVAQERASKLIDRWCMENNFKLLSKKLDRLSSIRGPFALDLSANRPVYAVTVKAQTGELRKATIACGSWGQGLLSDQIKVVWGRACSDKKAVEKPAWDEFG